MKYILFNCVTYRDASYKLTDIRFSNVIDEKSYFLDLTYSHNYLENYKQKLKDRNKFKAYTAKIPLVLLAQLYIDIIIYKNNFNRKIYNKLYNLCARVYNTYTLRQCLTYFDDHFLFTEEIKSYSSNYEYKNPHIILSYFILLNDYKLINNYIFFTLKHNLQRQLTFNDLIKLFNYSNVDKFKFNCELRFYFMYNLQENDISMPIIKSNIVDIEHDIVREINKNYNYLIRLKKDDYEEKKMKSLKEIEINTEDQILTLYCLINKLPKFIEDKLSISKTDFDPFDETDSKLFITELKTVIYKHYIVALMKKIKNKVLQNKKLKIYRDFDKSENKEEINHLAMYYYKGINEKPFFDILKTTTKMKEYKTKILQSKNKVI